MMVMPDYWLLESISGITYKDDDGEEPKLMDEALDRLRLL